MKKVLFLLATVALLLVPQTALAYEAPIFNGNGNYVISKNFFCNDNLNRVLKDGKTFFSADSELSGEIYSIFVKSGSVIDYNGTICVEKGLIAVTTGNDNLVIKTGTETANISENSEMVIKVDDYGNAFNYCINGSVELISLDGNSTVLNPNEYIAVTVKRGIRILKDTSLSEVEKLGAKFLDIKEIHDVSDTEMTPITVIETDFSENLITMVTAGKVYKLRSSSVSYSERLYLDCALDEAKLTVYDSEFNFIGESSNSVGAIKPNVSIKGDDTDTFYIVVTSDKLSEISLCHEKDETLFDRMFELAKRIAIPAGVALVVAVIIGVIKQKRKT